MFTLAFPGNPGKLRQPQISIYSDGNRPTLYSPEDFTTGMICVSWYSTSSCSCHLSSHSITPFLIFVNIVHVLIMLSMHRHDECLYLHRLPRLSQRICWWEWRHGFRLLRRRLGATFFHHPQPSRSRQVREREGLHFVTTFFRPLTCRFVHLLMQPLTHPLSVP